MLEDPDPGLLVAAYSEVARDSGPTAPGDVGPSREVLL